MGITGNLATMELTELLQWLSQGQKTGTLVVDHAEISKKVYFQGGLIVSSASSDPKEYLGQFLVGYQHITEEQLSEAISRQEEQKKLLGAILIEMGLISHEDLDQMLRLKAEETIYSLFEWGEGDFRFLDNELPEYELVKISIDVTGLILEGMRRLDELNRMRSVIPSPDAVPVVVKDDALLQDPELTDAERYVLQAIDDDRTVAEIALETRAQEYHVNETLFRAHQAGLIKVVRARIKTVVETVVETRVEKVVERVEVPAAPVAGQYPPQMQPPPGAYPYPTAPPGYAPAPAPPAMAPPEVPPSPAASLLAQAEASFSRRRFVEALEHARKATSLDPSNPTVKPKADAIEEKILSTIDRAGIVGKAVPQLAVSFEELTKLDASPKAGFILSRVNGSYDIDSILKISPMSPLEAKLVILELVEGGQIRI